MYFDRGVRSIQSVYSCQNTNGSHKLGKIGPVYLFGVLPSLYLLSETQLIPGENNVTDDFRMPFLVLATSSVMSSLPWMLQGMTWMRV
jgi:hypothetical protein